MAITKFPAYRQAGKHLPSPKRVRAGRPIIKTISIFNTQFSEGLFLGVWAIGAYLDVGIWLLDFWELYEGR